MSREDIIACLDLLAENVNEQIAARHRDLREIARLRDLITADQAVVESVSSKEHRPFIRGRNASFAVSAA